MLLLGRVLVDVWHVRKVCFVKNAFVFFLSQMVQIDGI